ncbi:hypothetical protein [Paenibacillus sp. B1-33]|uniref:hypothetical protein n=1 Tax=unclassified Paenibacillus TaxID=185978 RepID=UPI003D2A7183
MIKRIKLRTFLIGGIFSFFFLVIILRLFWYQVINQPFWMEQARDTWALKKELIPVRGTIYDKNGDVLAMDAPAYTVAVSPRMIQELRKNKELNEQQIDMERIIVDKLHRVLKKPEQELYELTRKTRRKNDKEEYLSTG